MSGPLAGIRVIDFCWVGAGSFATKLLADHGADVVKVESEHKVDGLRLSPPFAGGVAGVNRSGYFSDRNTSKRSLALNLSTPRARELALELVAGADIVANNFAPGVMDRFGLGVDAVLARNPRIVYLSMSMQGSHGPWRDHIGYGSTMGALAGLHELTGEAGREPIGTGTNYPDHVPNPTHAAVAVLAALRHARRTGRGQHVDLAQVEPTVAALGGAILERSITGGDPQRQGNRHAEHAPHNVYRTAGDDRWIAIAVRTDAEWEALRQVLDLDAAPGWASQAARKADEDAVDAAIGVAIAQCDGAALAEKLRARGVGAGIVATAADLVVDPQLVSRGHWQRLTHAEMGATLYASTPFRLSATPGRLRRPAPMLGEHTREVAAKLLELPEDDVERLIAEGVFT